MKRAALDLPEVTAAALPNPKPVRRAVDIVEALPDLAFDLVVDGRNADASATLQKALAEVAPGRATVRCWYDRTDRESGRIHALVRAAFVLALAPDLVLTSDNGFEDACETLFPNRRDVAFPQIVDVTELGGWASNDSVLLQLLRQQVDHGIAEVDAARRRASAALNEKRLRLAFVAQANGDVETSRLLEALSDRYDVTLCGPDHVWPTQWRATSRMSLEEFDADRSFDRILYSLADRASALPLLDRLSRRPGVLHVADGSLSTVLSAADKASGNPSALMERLFYTHGHAPDRSLAAGKSIDSVARRLPGDRGVLEQALGVLAPRSFVEQAASLYGARALQFLTPSERPTPEIEAAVECAHATARTALPRLIEAVRRVATDDVLGGFDAAARTIAESFPGRMRKRQLFVDVSSICRHDVRTGIQRVVRAIVSRWLAGGSGDLAVTPVYLTRANGRWTYHHARRWSAHLSGMPLADVDRLDDPVAEPDAGDILIVLDFTGALLHLPEEQERFFTDLRNRGLHVCALVYDLLPLRQPEFFPTVATEHGRWIGAVAGIADQIVCISQAVADDVRSWFDENGVVWSGRIDSFHLGSDIESSHPTTGISPALAAAMKTLESRPTLLAVGTVEPRKGQAQILEAFEHLDGHGTPVNLVIVGKLGWMSEQLKDRIEDHPMLGQALFWFPDVSDEGLMALYAVADVLVAASHGEGFGLPLVEAAQRDLPILARDIPVFREVAGDHAAYFTGVTGADLAAAIETWLARRATDTHPTPDGMPWLTWEESAASLLQLVLKGAALSGEGRYGVAGAPDQDGKSPSMTTL